MQASSHDDIGRSPVAKAAMTEGPDHALDGRPQGPPLRKMRANFRSRVAIGARVMSNSQRFSTVIASEAKQSSAAD
jgi:hypothetical protein